MDREFLINNRADRMLDLVEAINGLNAIKAKKDDAMSSFNVAIKAQEKTIEEIMKDINDKPTLPFEDGFKQSDNGLRATKLADLPPGFEED